MGPHPTQGVASPQSDAQEHLPAVGRSNARLLLFVRSMRLRQLTKTLAHRAKRHSHSPAGGGSGAAASERGEPLRTTSGRCIVGDLGSERSPSRRRSYGRQVKDFSAPRFRRSAHRAPAGDARCDRGPPPAPPHVRAARDRAPAPCGGAERHAAVAAASPTDRGRARDGAEARGMDALALVMSDQAASPTPPRGS